MKFLDSLSETTQVILLMVVLGLLFLLVMANNKKNKNKFQNRRGRSFRENVKNKRKQRDSE